MTCSRTEGQSSHNLRYAQRAPILGSKFIPKLGGELWGRMEEDLYCELHCGSALHSPICLPDMSVVAVGRGPTTKVISRKCSRRQVYTTFDCCLHTNIGSNNGVELVSLPREGLASETSVECTQCHLGYPPLAQGYTVLRYIRHIHNSLGTVNKKQTCHPHSSQDCEIHLHGNALYTCTITVAVG